MFYVGKAVAGLQMCSLETGFTKDTQVARYAPRGLIQERRPVDNLPAEIFLKPLEKIGSCQKSIIAGNDRKGGMFASDGYDFAINARHWLPHRGVFQIKCLYRDNQAHRRKLKIDFAARVHTKMDYISGRKSTSGANRVELGRQHCLYLYVWMWRADAPIPMAPKLLKIAIGIALKIANHFDAAFRLLRQSNQRKPYLLNEVSGLATDGFFEGKKHG
jgi:hypothetical protein